MKQLQKSDLKLGEIYWFVGSTIKFLNKISSINIDEYDCYLYNTTYFAGKGKNLSIPVNILEATPEEKHWLETCIKADQFVPYEEAMKTFIPEYVECIKEEKPYNFYGDLGKIYKVDNWNHSHYDCMLIGTTSGSTCKNRFKPSTKEAYDAQFVVKEPEFVLPEKWRIKLTFENQKTVIDYINKNTKDGERSGNIGMYYGYNGEHCTCIFNTLSNTEITFDQFKQYVLKENTTVTEEPKVVLEEPKDKVLAHFIQSDITLIHSVECSEGGVYRIGDKITVFDKYSPNKGKVFTIHRFRWSNDKSKICAVTELHTPNGIGLDKIELYVKHKVKVKDEFVLPENWYIKVTDDNKEVLQQYICNIHDSIMITLSNINYIAYSKWLNGINRTENKLGYGLISKLNLNPLPNIYRAVTYYNGVEITFEQFKKYVLKDE